MTDETRLYDWVDTYAISRNITEETLTSYRRNIRVAEKWAQQPLTSLTICDDILNRLLSDMLTAGRAPDHLRSVRSVILAIWRDMAYRGLCAPPKRIRSVRCPPVRHTVWTPQQVSQLVHVAEKLPGRFRVGHMYPRGPYWGSLIRTAWDSGLRHRDLQALKKPHIKPEFTRIQSKTQKPVKVRLRQSTLDSIARLERSDEAVLWPMWGARESFHMAWDKLVGAAGLPYGPFKTLRKSAGTAAEAAHPGAGLTKRNAVVHPSCVAHCAKAILR